MTDLEPALTELDRRLAADLAAVLASIGDLDQAQADWRPGPGRWSPGEVLHHLVLANRLFAKAVAALIERGLRKGLTARPDGQRAWPRLAAVADASVSGEVQHPADVTPEPGRPIDELRRDLGASHAAVADQIPRLAGLDLAALRLPHPLGFKLNLFEWVDITGAHERRHLAQLETIMATPGFPSRPKSLSTTPGGGPPRGAAT